jgi:hypothetical protein
VPQLLDQAGMPLAAPDAYAVPQTMAVAIDAPVCE